MWWLLAACQQPAVCDNGLDRNNDGICDRDLADWSDDARLPASGERGNIYGLSETDLAEVRLEGLEHAYTWPVEISGLLLPYDAMSVLLSGQNESVAALARAQLGYATLEEMYDWIGLVRFPETPVEGIVPPDGYGAGDPMGAGLVATDNGDALTFSCAACHVGSLFGRPVVGLPNRNTRANEFFVRSSAFVPSFDPALFQTMTGASESDMAMFEMTQDHMGSIGAKTPAALGLDTSLAQVALSLSRREPDAYASYSDVYEASPRANSLDTTVADSKVLPWWNLKYKTHWLSDGSIRSGNPVHTNFLWNELGRGTDLHELETWFETNGEKVDALTVAVFATEAPQWTDFFPESTLDLPAAKRGETLFVANCSECHGTYEKDWTVSPNTVSVDYHEQTPVFDVGTDPQRAQGMAAFAEGLNGLAISNAVGTTVDVQAGYVPPPLVGIWARWPYLHNGSVPTLCALLSPQNERPTEFWLGPADNAATDFDVDCIGGPTGAATPTEWTSDPSRHFDTSLPGLSNAGHTERFTNSDGSWLFSADERQDLIEFLRTL